MVLAQTRANIVALDKMHMDYRVYTEYARTACKNKKIPVFKVKILVFLAALRTCFGDRADSKPTQHGYLSHQPR
eukprot:m.631284 g.631284  ORF g.631284 m.631284 type:complete len:74 (+) comp22573_c0_seq5:259-480(+)